MDRCVVGGMTVVAVGAGRSTSRLYVDTLDGTSHAPIIIVGLRYDQRCAPVRRVCDRIMVRRRWRTWRSTGAIVSKILVATAANKLVATGAGVEFGGSAGGAGGRVKQRQVRIMGTVAGSALNLAELRDGRYPREGGRELTVITI